jgi:hypothetical protein
LSEFRIEPFAGQDLVDDQAVIELWTGEGVLGLEEARRRVRELALVATTAAGELAAVTTAYLAVHPHLDMRLWHLRAFVAEPYRRTTLGTTIAVQTRVHHQRLWAAGDRRGDGLVMEIENPILRRVFPWAHWPEMDFLFVGRAPTGAPIYAHYFQGALAPPLPGAAQGTQ